MTPLLLDTDVISYLLKGDTRYERYREIVEGRLIAASFMTIAELRRGASQNGWGDKRLRNLEHLLGQCVHLYPDDRTCRIWAEIMVKATGTGSILHVADAWIAAVAIQHGCTLVSHNQKHFRRIEGLDLISRA